MTNFDSSTTVRIMYFIPLTVLHLFDATPTRNFGISDFGVFSFHRVSQPSGLRTVTYS